MFRGLRVFGYVGLLGISVVGVVFGVLLCFGFTLCYIEGFVVDMRNFGFILGVLDFMLCYCDFLMFWGYFGLGGVLGCVGLLVLMLGVAECLSFGLQVCDALLCSLCLLCLSGVVLSFLVGLI